MLKYTLGIYSFFILFLLSLDSSPTLLSASIHFYCYQHLLSSLFLYFWEKLVLSGQTPGSLCCRMHLFLPVACIPARLNLMPCFLPLPLLMLSHSDLLRWIYPHLDLTLIIAFPFTFILLYTFSPGLSPGLNRVPLN